MSAQITSMEEKKVEAVLIEGDGIGPEISEAVLHILERAGAPISWIPVLAGERAAAKGNDPLPEATVQSIKRARVALKGPLATAVGREGSEVKGFRSINVRLRKELDLYANLRPVRSLPNVRARYDNIDLVIVRENTEGLYSGLEQEVVPGVVTSLKVSTRPACTRIAEFAFAYAEKTRRKKVSAIHKANILKLSDGLALECYREVANQHPSVAYEEKIVDATAMGLVMNPWQFDVLLTENLYGDILSDLAAGLIGGLGLAPSANIGTEASVFEAVHGTAPDIAGKGLANPTALLLSALEMLKHIGKGEHAEQIERALFATLEQRELLTPDLGGKSSTMQFAREVAARL